MSKKIYIEEYNKKMDKIISNKKLSIDEKLEKMFDEASKYTIKGIKETK